MDFYDKKKDLFIAIERVVSINKFTKKEIGFAIMEQTGFGMRIILDYINFKIESGYYSVNEVGILGKSRGTLEKEKKKVNEQIKDIKESEVMKNGE